MHIRWTKTGEADVAYLDGDRIGVLSTIPSAPGSRPDGVVASGGSMKIKVAQCRKKAEHGDRFLIEGRLIDTRREVREEIAKLVAPSAPAAPPEDAPPAARERMALPPKH